MSLLGDFLEAIYGPTDRFRSVRAVIEQWQDSAAMGRALGSEKPHFGRKKVGSGSKTNASPQKTTLRVWLGGPNKVRIEETRQLNGVIQSSLTVVGGDRWWERDHQGHVEEGETEEETRRPGPNLTDIERHFFSASLREYCAGLALESLGTVRTANRDCVRVRAVPRPDGRLWRHWLGSGADEYELHADPERGVLLYVASKCLGELLEWNEVTEVFFDEVLADEFFTYEPQLGEQVRPSQPVVEHLTLAAAMRRMPFTVLIPTRVPDSDHARVEVMFHPANVNNSRAYLALMYRGVGHLSVRQSATPASLDEWEWEQVERDGRRMEISDPGPGEGTRLVRLEHLGTHVDIWADLDREQVLDLAASLAPASG